MKTSPIRPLSRSRRNRLPSNDVHPLSLGLFDGDTAGIIIRQQARRIDELERDVVRLRNKLDKEVGPNPASAEA